LEYYFVIAQPFIVAFVASLSSGGVTGVSVAGVVVFVLLVGGFILARRSNRQPERRFHGFFVVLIVQVFFHQLALAFRHTYDDPARGLW
jgi:hypothetical protein